MTRSGLVTSMSPVAAIWPAVTSPGPVAHDVGDVLADPRQAAELVKHALDLDRGDRGALKRREQYAAQAVAERHAEAALQWLGDEHCLAAAVATGLPLESLRLLEFLPILCVDGHVSSLAAGEAASRILLIWKFPGPALR
jgi:hypothetical protein